MQILKLETSLAEQHQKEGMAGISPVFHSLAAVITWWSFQDDDEGL